MEKRPRSNRRLSARKFLSSLLIAAVLQGGIYLYLDRKVLVPQVSFTEKAVPGSQRAARPGVYSFDGSYYAQVSASGLKIFSASGDQLRYEIAPKPNQALSYFSWLGNRDLALAGVGTDSAKGTDVALEPINLDTGSRSVVPRIGGLPRGARIVDVAFSTATNVVNILVRYGHSAVVYRTDANNYLRRLRLNTNSIRRIATLTNAVDLFYDSPMGGVVYMLDSVGRIRHISPKGGRYALVGVDGTDRIYIGRLNSAGEVDRVMVGDAGGHFRDFSSLSQPYSPDSVTIGYDGQLKLGDS